MANLLEFLKPVVLGVPLAVASMAFLWVAREILASDWARFRRDPDAIELPEALFDR